MCAHFSAQSTMRLIGASILVLVFVLVTGGTDAHGQSLTYSSGQNVSPAYEGWEEEANGDRYFLFGYMNRNWEEEIDVPIGPDNTFNIDGADQGQPTHFLPRRNRFVFRVPVPKTFTEKDELVWTLSTRGKTERAYATLRIDYKVDDVVRASETGALGAGSSSPEIRANTPPVLEVQGAKTMTAKVGQPLALAVLVTDDGVPKPRGAGLAGAAVSNPGSSRDLTTGSERSQNPVRVNRAMQPPFRSTVGKNVGLHVSWFLYPRSRCRFLRPRADFSVGGHAHRRQLALGADLDRPRHASRRQGADPGDVQPFRDLRLAGTGRRRRADGRRRGDRDSHTVECITTAAPTGSDCAGSIWLSSPAARSFQKTEFAWLLPDSGRFP